MLPEILFISVPDLCNYMSLALTGRPEAARQKIWWQGKFIAPVTWTSQLQLAVGILEEVQIDEISAILYSKTSLNLVTILNKSFYN